MHARRDDLLTTEVDDQLVLLDLRGARYLRMNRTGRMLWELLQQDRLPADLAAALQERFSLDAERALADVDAYLATLRARDLLEEPTPQQDAARIPGQER